METREPCTPTPTQSALDFPFCHVILDAGRAAKQQPFPISLEIKLRLNGEIVLRVTRVLDSRFRTKCDRTCLFIQLSLMFPFERSLSIQIQIEKQCSLRTCYERIESPLRRLAFLIRDIVM